MSFGNYLENELLDHVFGCGSRNFTAPTNVFVALSTADPGEDGSGLAEPSGGSYARVSTGSAAWNVASGGVVNNASAVTFPQATAAWGTITHVALYDAASGGNLLASGALTSSKAVASGDTVEFAAGQLSISLD